MFSIRLLGRASVEGEGPVASALLQRHRLALLALLATAPGRALSRDKLIAYLWPESDTPRARHLLRSAVHVLRRELGEEAVLSQGDALRLNSERISSDVGDFLDHVERRELENAVRVYAGPFLDGFHVNDAPEFERWLDAERDRLERMFRQALEELAEQASARGSVAEAVEWWRKLTALDPFSARVTLGLMRSLEAAGDRAAAIQLARGHEELLEQELGAEPDPSVSAFAERLRISPVPTMAVDSYRPASIEPSDAQSTVHDSPPAVPTPAWLHPATRPSRRFAIAALVIVAIAASAITYAVFAKPDSSSKAATPPDAHSIAVLPFTNVGGDPNEEYFSDGLTEELIAALARVQDLRVAARTSAFAFKGEDRDIRQIATALNVATVLEGSVRRDGERVRVHAQLINATDGYHIWTETYERNASDIFGLQTELAVAIAKAMKPTLTTRERRELGRSATENVAAHTAYLKGRYVWHQRTGGSLRKAIEYFEEAIAADSNYARAYAGLASAYGPMGVHGFIAPAVARERMLAATLRALAIEPDLAEARTALATYRNTYQWDFPGAEKEYLRALALDSSESTGPMWYGFMLEYLGRYDEALVQRRTAMELDPVSPATNGGYGTSLMLSGRYAEAVEQLSKAVELDSAYWQSHLSMGIAYEVTGDLEKAIAAYEKTRFWAGTSPKGTAAVAAVFQRVGRAGEGIRLLDSLRADAKRMGVHAPAIAHAILPIDGADAALDWLELSFHEKHPDLPRVLTDPRCDPLRQNPRFIQLRKRVGLQPLDKRVVDGRQTRR